jgi:CheY-like chemotaxis protein
MYATEPSFGSCQLTKPSNSNSSEQAMCNILVVEDEIFVAAEIENVVEELGYSPIGIAADSRTALTLASIADVALVDLNLLDGPTGTELGRKLAEMHGITVLYMTANPGQLASGVPGTVGVLPKPVSDSELKAALEFVVSWHMAIPAAPPSRMRLFQGAA